MSPSEYKSYKQPNKTRPITMDVVLKQPETNTPKANKKTLEKEKNTEHQKKEPKKQQLSKKAPDKKEKPTPEKAIVKTPDLSAPQTSGKTRTIKDNTKGGETKRGTLTASSSQSKPKTGTELIDDTAKSSTIKTKQITQRSTKKINKEPAKPSNTEQSKENAQTLTKANPKTLPVNQTTDSSTKQKTPNKAINKKDLTKELAKQSVPPAKPTEPTEPTEPTKNKPSKTIAKKSISSELLETKEETQSGNASKKTEATKSNNPLFAAIQNAKKSNSVVSPQLGNLQPLDESNLGSESIGDPFSEFETLRNQVHNEYLAKMSEQVREYWTPPDNSVPLKTRIRLYLSSRGFISDIYIEESSGSLPFDLAALRAIKSVRQFELPKNPTYAQHFRKLVMSLDNFSEIEKQLLPEQSIDELPATAAGKRE